MKTLLARLGQIVGFLLCLGSLMFGAAMIYAAGSLPDYSEPQPGWWIPLVVIAAVLGAVGLASWVQQQRQQQPPPRPEAHALTVLTDDENVGGQKISPGGYVHVRRN